MSRFRTEWQFLAALVLAAAFSDVASKAGRKRVFRSFGLWLRIIGRGARKVAPDVRAKRLAACEACPLFYRPLRTCGSPLDKGNSDLGCWCQMDRKSAWAEAECWIDQEWLDELPYGWNKHGL